MDLARASSPATATTLIVTLAALIGLASLQPASAQGFGRIDETRTNVAYFYHARPGEATVQISLWGTIPRPGIYEVSDTTDLDKLLTMAGGIPAEARVEGRDPKVTVRLYRTQDDQRRVIYQASLDSLLAAPGAYPSLQDDDVVVVETIRPGEGLSLRDGLSILSTLGTLTLLVIRIFSR